MDLRRHFSLVHILYGGPQKLALLFLLCGCILGLWIQAHFCELGPDYVASNLAGRLVHNHQLRLKQLVYQAKLLVVVSLLQLQCCRNLCAKVETLYQAQEGSNVGTLMREEH